MGEAQIEMPGLESTAAPKKGRTPSSGAGKNGAGTVKPRSRAGGDVRGFGFQPAETEHHFLVTIGTNEVLISEHTRYHDGEVAPTSLVSHRDDARLRVIVARRKWDLLADPVRATFNRRLKQVGAKTGQWSSATPVPLARPFGKELVLLAWAVEDADPGQVPTAVENWKGLQPEERWWLYTMTCAATGHVTEGRNKGWRKAVRFALTENPVTLGACDDDDAFTLESEAPETPEKRVAAAKARPKKESRQP